MKKIPLVLFVIFLSGFAFAQKDKTWNVKLGIYSSGLIFENLPMEYAVSVYDPLIKFVSEVFSEQKILFFSFKCIAYLRKEAKYA
ncbi:hypothetical protein [Thermoflexibacter ruber]|uniref:Uncharacterized protein n=1 Tax=Thermoflexibacter ruber TaxID=1003 RepID=A0A1I2JGK0_9BACT|nr:hypothetical protein [Thermoflexibacter ruber]SFF52983.1 hypothetical protein SAMN04488541_104917 [Thermoflexibacter ruber]